MYNLNTDNGGHLNGSNDYLLPDGVCGEEAYFFIQTPCVVPEENMKMRLFKGFLVSLTAIGISAFSIYSLFKLKIQQK